MEKLKRDYETLQEENANLNFRNGQLEAQLDKLVGGINAMVDLEDEFGDDLQVAALLAELKKITQGK